MTYKARVVLSDCRIALSLLENETDLQKWRILWAGAVALIRAVGHVLDKVDGSNPVVKQIAKESFSKWKVDDEHLIFPEFIERERNILLKEYNSDVHPLEEVPMALEMVLQPLSEGNQKAQKTVTLGDIINLGENLYRPMFEGPWQGADSRDIYQKAIEWWEKQLDSIDRQVKSKTNNTNTY